jgi:signal peptidase I
MLKPKRLSVAILSASLTVTMIIIWVALAPVQVGGPVAYVIVNGNSMEPLYHRGDLVLTRQTDHYAVGDIVAYQHPQVGLIIHRIVAENQSLYTMKGDHNTWLDSYHPSAAEVVGKAWWQWPGAGQTLTQLRQPAALASLTVVLAGFVMLTMVTPRLPAAPNRQGGRRRQLNLNTMKQLNQHQESLFYLLGVIAFAALVLGAVAFTRPLTQEVSEGVPYEHRGKFSYTATAPADIYDQPIIETGDPIFRRLTDSVKINFEYQLSSESLNGVGGTYRLLAEVSDSVNNWKRTIELRPKTEFSGDLVAISGILDLDQLQSLVANVNQQTGVARQYYTVKVIPEVSVHATVEGHTLEEQFAPALTFQANDLEMYLAAQSPLENVNPLKPTLGGMYQKTTTQPNTIPIFGYELNVLLARALALAGVALAVLGLAAVVIAQVWASRQDEAAVIELKYGASLVALNGEDPVQGRPLVGVQTMEELARMAEREGRMILHRPHDDTHRYYVQDTAVVYYYDLKSSEPKTLSVIDNDQAIESWVHTLTLKKIEERQRLFQLAELTMQIATRLGLPSAQVELIRQGTLLHDVGKVAVPDAILLKAGPLTDDEWQSIRSAPNFANAVLAPTQLRPALDIPYCAYEHWDGSGYPRGLANESIPLAARIFAVANAWDAMLSDRPYRPALSGEQARQYLREQAGRQFDPKIVQVFLEIVEGVN